MKEMNFGHLLPFYLDETDEQVVSLNDTLLQLEQNQEDPTALAVAFRIVHTIKGSSAALGFTEVNRLTHHLESFFELLRSGKCKLDKSSLDLFFRCLDELRNYHQRLRETGESDIDFSQLIAEVEKQLRHVQNPPAAKAKDAAKPLAAEAQSRRTRVPSVTLGENDRLVEVLVRFAADLSLPDMKARLIAKRLAALGEIIETDPPMEKLDDVAELTSILYRVATEASDLDLTKAADMSGVASITVTEDETAEAASETTTPPATPAPAAPASPVPAVVVESPVAQPVALPAELPEPAAETATAQVPAAQPAAPQGEAATAKSAPKPVGKVGETVRVELERLDQLMNLTGELVLSKSRFVQVASALKESVGGSSRRIQPSESMDRVKLLKRTLKALSTGEATIEAVAHRMDEELSRLADELGAITTELGRARSAKSSVEDLAEAVHQLTRVCDGLQKGVLDTRMIPIGPLFERFRRVIRDLSHATGKEIRLKISGEATELDKRVIDELADPLVHMVRNAGDHGLEPPDERERAGKPRYGTVSLSAAHSGDRVIITVADDGRGINAERLRTKVVEKGLVDADTAGRLSDRELISYIWHPGFSTAESVTDISGRGVGMDIVKSRIEALSGTVDIRTTPGQGTTFVIRLPLTLAILPSLLVRAQEVVYAIALDHIREIVEAQPGQIHEIRNRRVIEIRKKIVPVVSLNDLFVWGNRPYVKQAVPASGTDDAHQTTRVVILHSADEMVGLEVDQLMGLQEVVLKSLEKNLGAVAGLSGASILGDGRVSLILDVDWLIDRASNGLIKHNGVA